MQDIEALIRDIELEAQATGGWTGRMRFDPRVMDALRATPRDRFVPDTLKLLAFDNGPLQIGHGQTISQPYIVALMTDLLDPAPTDQILEIGTGSGYQAAVLSRLVAKVFTLEIIPELATAASRRLRRLGCDNVAVGTGDGGRGWPEHAPYDGIIVTAAAPAIPPPLIDQLRVGRNLVVPIGPPHGHQQLVLGTKQADGTLTTRVVLDVAFVPLTGSMGARADAPDR